VLTAPCSERSAAAACAAASTQSAMDILKMCCCLFMILMAGCVIGRTGRRHGGIRADAEARQACRGERRAHFARQRSGQLRWMIDRHSPRRGRSVKVRGNNSDGLADRQNKNATHQGGRVIMRGAAVVMTRPAVSLLAVGMGMRHAVRMGGNLPMLEGMGGVGHGQKRQAGQPKNAESASREHLGPKLSRGVAWSNPFNTARHNRFHRRPVTRVCPDLQRTTEHFGALLVVSWPKVKNGLGFQAGAVAILP